MNPQTIAVLDFGSQYSQLIARRVRDLHVHSVLCAPDVSPDQLERMNAVGVILSGGQRLRRGCSSLSGGHLRDRVPHARDLLRHADHV